MTQPLNTPNLDVVEEILDRWHKSEVDAISSNSQLDIQTINSRGEQPERILLVGGEGCDLSRLIQPSFIAVDELHYSLPHAVQEWTVNDLDFHYKGETPRGTSPSFIGGVKKTKQQRAAIKARRKQR